MKRYQIDDEISLYGLKSRTIIKKDVNTELCHHLKIVLNKEKSIFLFGKNVNSFIVKTALNMPYKNKLSLDLSLNKFGKTYCCPQCGCKYNEKEYYLYKSLFSEAKQKQFNVWELKKIFALGNRFSKAVLFQKITKGTQKYECEVSRIMAAFIILKKDQNALYDELIKNF